MIKKNFFIILLLSLILGCASNGSNTDSGKFPEWVENPDALYPKRLYLTAVSSGSSLDEARQRTIGTLSNIFSVNVKLDRRILEAYSEKTKGDEMEGMES